MDGKPKGRGGKLTRSETVTVRLDPKLRYLAELAALKHRRTLSSFIEWAIEDSLGRVKLREGTGYDGDHGSTVADDTAELWDVDEADRFAKLALRYPDLLTHEEQKRWKLIRENGLLWRGRLGTDGAWEWKVAEDKLILDRLRDYWEIFCEVARGEKDPSELPAWVGKNPTPMLIPPSKTTDDFDDDIPF
jgi:hypothetical protein